MTSFFNKLLFAPSLFYTMFLNTATDQNWYDRIDKCVVLGALPLRSTIDELRSKENVRGVLSMNEDFELNSLWYPTKEQLLSKGIEFKQLPVEDYIGHPTWKQAEEGLAFIDGVCGRNASVYLHCKAGRYRSALMAATYLMHRYNVTPEYAESVLKAHRKQVWLRQAETTTLRQFAQKMGTLFTTSPLARAPSLLDFVVV